MREIKSVEAHSDWTLSIVLTDGTAGTFNVKPYLSLEAFMDLHDPDEFKNIHNGGYFVEWECGADLSADTVRAKMEIRNLSPNVVKDEKVRESE
jgi:hypothetical protein